MFKMFKKKEVSLCAPVDGKVIDITDVKDEVFSQKMLGEGFAIETAGTLIHAPFDATVSMVFPSMHAIGLTDENGFELLIHVGIDTVKENGTGFSSFVKVDEKVKQGAKLIEIDLPELQKKGYDMTTVLVFTKPDAYSAFQIQTSKEAKANDIIATYRK